jgi:hypothetical protein
MAIARSASRLKSGKLPKVAHLRRDSLVLLECVRCRRKTCRHSMDINEWLEGTVEAEERTTLPDQLGFPAFLQPKDKPAVQRSARRHGKRMRHSADSSILKLEEPAAVPSRRKPDTAYDCEGLLWAHQDSSPALSSAHSVENNEGSDHYRRRPRRKTRPERYEAKTAKEPAKDRDRHERKRGKKGKGAKPAKKRRIDKSGLAGVVHNYQARNIPRERLTVRVLHTKVSFFLLIRAAAAARHLQERESIITLQGARM